MQLKLEKHQKNKTTLAQYSSSDVIHLSRTPEIQNWSVKMLFAPSRCDRTHAPTLDGVRADAFILAATVKISAQKKV